MRFMPFALAAALAVPAALASLSGAAAHEALIAKHAAAYGIPESLVRRVIQIESRGNPRAVSKGNYGLMQIRLGTARAMGYRGDAQGLLDADVNMTYAVRYLAGAYRAAGGSEAGAIRNYQRGYYYQAKKQGFSPYSVASASSTAVPTPSSATPAAAAPEPVREPRRSRAQRNRDSQPLSLLPAFLTGSDAKPAPAKRARKSSGSTKAKTLDPLGFFAANATPPRNETR